MFKLCLLILATSATVLAVEIPQQQQQPQQPCDTIWSTITRGCVELRSSIVTNADSPKAACCNNIKFQTCVKAAEAYAAMAKLTRVCPKEVYDQKMQSLEAPSDLISTLCGSFNAQICVTDSISTYWNQLATQFNGKAIGDTIEQNFNTAVNQLSSIAKSVGQSLNEQRIPERFASGLESIQNTFNDRAKEVSKVVAPSRDVNRYSIVGEKDPAASGVDELVDSFFPSVEIVQKEPAVPVEDTTTTTKKVISSAPNRFPFMDWFQSGYERASTFMKGIGKGAAGGVNSGPETPKGSDNPYSNNPQ